jgi:hypothetical protein
LGNPQDVTNVSNSSSWTVDKFNKKFWERSSVLPFVFDVVAPLLLLVLLLNDAVLEMSDGDTVVEVDFQTILGRIRTVMTEL